MASESHPLRAPLILAAGAMTVMSGAAIAPALGKLNQELSSGTSAGIDRFVLILPVIVVLFAGPVIGQLTVRVTPSIGMPSGLTLLGFIDALGGLASSYVWLFVT